MSSIFISWGLDRRRERAAPCALPFCFNLEENEREERGLWANWGKLEIRSELWGWKMIKPEKCCARVSGGWGIYRGMFGAESLCDVDGIYVSQWYPMVWGLSVIDIAIPFKIFAIGGRHADHASEKFGRNKIRENMNNAYFRLLRYASWWSCGVDAAICSAWPAV